MNNTNSKALLFQCLHAANQLLITKNVQFIPVVDQNHTTNNNNVTNQGKKTRSKCQIIKKPKYEPTTTTKMTMDHLTPQKTCQQGRYLNKSPDISSHSKFQTTVSLKPSRHSKLSEHHNIHNRSAILLTPRKLQEYSKSELMALAVGNKYKQKIVESYLKEKTLTPSKQK